MSSIASPLVMLHLGLGSFHRAHQAVYLHELIASGDARWCLAGGNIRPDMAETIAALAAQGGAYTLETISPAGEHRYTRITSIRQVIPYTPDLAGLIAQGASSDTRIAAKTTSFGEYSKEPDCPLTVPLPLTHGSQIEISTRMPATNSITIE